MTDERLGQVVGAWLRDIEPPPPDPRQSLARAMASVRQTPQAHRSGLPAFLTRDTVPVRPIDGWRVGSSGSDRFDGRGPGANTAQTGGSHKMAIATLASFGAAVLLVGALLLQGGTEDTDPAVPEPAETSAATAVPAEEATTHPSASPAVDDMPPVTEGTWRQLPESPFGSTAAAGAWTGESMLVVDIPSGRAAEFDPGADVWTELQPGSAGFDPSSPWVWTGSELLIFDGTDGSGAGRAFDPATDTWRDLASGPLTEPRLAVWAEGDLVDGLAVVAGHDKTMAAYDPAVDAWAEVPDIPGAKKVTGLYWSGYQVIATTIPNNPGKVWLAELDLDPEYGISEWNEPIKGPIHSSGAAPQWADDRLLFAGGGPNEADRVLNAAYSGLLGWVERDFDCPATTGSGLWDGALLIDVLTGEDPDPRPPYALHPRSGRCTELPDSEVRRRFLEKRDPALTILAGEEIILWSGSGGDPTSPPDRNAIAFTPELPEPSVDWGPLAVVEGGEGPDAGFGPVTLSIGANCVTVKGDRAESDTTLVWGSHQTSWRPKNRRIVFEHRQHGTIRLSDGDRVTFGGMSLSSDSPEGDEQMAAWLEESWVHSPDPSCPASMWLVGEVLVLKDEP